MTTNLPQTYTHSTPLTTLAPHLLPLLPKSLPLLRRLQFHTSSPSARTIATFPPSSTTTTTTTPPTSFAATFADRTRTPETECWLFSTYETLPAPTTQQHRDAKAQCLALLAAIARLPASTTPLTVIGSLNESVLLLIGGEEVGGLVPQSVVSRDGKGGDDDGDVTGRKGVNGSVISNISVPYRKWLIAPPPPPRAADGEGGTRNSRNGNVNRDENGKSPPLPPAYAFSTLRRHELALTISRTAIPKTEDTLATLGSVGVRYSPTSTSTATSNSTSDATSTSTTAITPTPTPTAADPEHVLQEREHQPGSLIAWAFLGIDGSLTSLHVEPGHRGRGIAKAVSRRLFRCLAEDAGGMGFRAVGGGGGGGEGVRDDGVGEGGGGGGGGGGEYDYCERGGEGWAHSDVAEDNLESAGVVRGLGGREGWRVRWVGVDLGAVGGRGGG